MPTHLPSLSRNIAALGVAAGITCAAACSTARNSATPPPAEFLLSSTDSTFWVSTRSGTARIRGVPLVLTRYDGRFYELYADDDDFSYDDALLLGERLYRRELASGDSVAVFADTIIPRVATAYARSHPDERPLEPNEEGEANPSTSATAEVDILDVFGPYLSYEYHVDIDLPRGQPWHATRRGVIDLRSGKSARLADLFGAETGRRLEAAGRATYEAARDSVVRERGALSGEDERAAAALEHLQFDALSFSLSNDGGQPAVAFAVPGKGEGAAGNLVELDPVKVAATDWWRDSQSGLPANDSSDDDVWQGAGYQVVARYDTSGDVATLTLADAARREWPLATMLGPLRRITWLDRPPIDAADRKVLLRAFSAAASYDEASRVAALPAHPRSASAAPLLHLASIHALRQDRSRKPARNIRAHDARAREQHGPRVRRRDPVDDGQDRGHRRLSTQPVQRRHRVD